MKQAADLSASLSALEPFQRRSSLVRECNALMELVLRWSTSPPLFPPFNFFVFLLLLPLVCPSEIQKCELERNGFSDFLSIDVKRAFYFNFNFPFYLGACMSRYTNTIYMQPQKKEKTFNPHKRASKQIRTSESRLSICPGFGDAVCVPRKHTPFVLLRASTTNPQWL